jgi:uncharacterized iron-regulated membrane protein
VSTGFSAQRKRAYRLHRVVGVGLALWLVLLSVTGALLMFRPELDWLTTPALRVSPAGDDHAAWDAERVLRGAQAHAPGARIVRLDRPETQRSASLVRVETERGLRDLFVHPRTGAVLGGRDIGGSHHSVADVIRQLHVRVLLGAWGRTLVGVLGLVWLVALLTGWWVHGRGKQKARRVARSSRRTAGAWRTRLHAGLAYATLPYALLMGVSGAWLGLETLPHLLQRLGPDRHVDETNHAPELTAPQRLTAGLAFVDAHAERALPGSRVSALFPPEHAAQTWLATLEHTEPWLPRGLVALDLPGTPGGPGKLHEVTVGDHLTGALEALHVGSFTRHAGPLDVPLRVLWALLGLTPVVVALAGLYGTYRRRRAQARSQPSREWALPTPAPLRPLPGLSRSSHP